MAKKQIKYKSPVQIRTRSLKNGYISLYLDIYRGAKEERIRENLKLTIIPERKTADKIVNQNTLRKAEAIRLKRCEELENGTYIAPLKRTKGDKDNRKNDNDLTIIDFIDQLNEEKERRNFKNLKYILSEQNKNYLIKDYDINVIREFLSFISCDYEMKRKRNSTQKKLSPLSQIYYLSALRFVLNIAEKKGIIENNPMTKLDRYEIPKRNERHPTFLTDEEIKILIKTDYTEFPTIKNAFLFGIFTGLRISDIKTLKWENLVSENGTLFINKQMVKVKTKIIHTPVSEQASKWLPEKIESNLVFPKLQVTMNTIEKHLSKWTKLCNINKHITFHVSRHTCATELLYLGADLYTVSKILGHSSIATTQIYAHLLDKQKISAINLFDKKF